MIGTQLACGNADWRRMCHGAALAALFLEQHGECWQIAAAASAVAAAPAAAAGARGEEEPHDGLLGICCNWHFLFSIVYSSTVCVNRAMPLPGNAAKTERRHEAAGALSSGRPVVLRNLPT